MRPRLLIDNALSPVLGDLLSAAGYDCVHVRQYGMQAAKDPEVFDRAAAEDRVVISADTDFAAILALREALKPSLVILREPLSQNRPDVQAKVLIVNLPGWADVLNEGSIVTLKRHRVRVRRLPLTGRSDQA